MTETLWRVDSTYLEAQKNKKRAQERKPHFKFLLLTPKIQSNGLGNFYDSKVYFPS